MLDEQIYSQEELKEKVRTLLSEEKISVLRFIEQGKDTHWLMMWLKERVDKKLQYIDIHLERYKEEEIKKEEIRNFIEYIILEQQRNKRKMTYTVAGLVLFVLIIGSIITAMFESDESARMKPDEEETTLANALNREPQEDSKSSIVKTDDNQKEESKDKKEPVKKEEPKDKKEPVKKEEPKDKKEPVKKEESKDKKEPVKKEEPKDKKEPVKKEETTKDESNSSNKIEDTTAKAEEPKKESNSEKDKDKDKDKEKDKDKDKDKASDDEKGWWQKFLDFFKSLFGLDDEDESKDSAAKAEDKKAEKQKEKEKALEEKRAEKEKALEEKRAEKQKALEEKKAKEKALEEKKAEKQKEKEKALEEKKAEKAKEKEEDKETEEKGFWASIADFFKTLFGMNDEPKEKEKE